MIRAENIVKIIRAKERPLSRAKKGPRSGGEQQKYGARGAPFLFCLRSLLVFARLVRLFAFSAAVGAELHVREFVGADIVTAVFCGDPDPRAILTREVFLRRSLDSTTPSPSLVRTRPPTLGISLLALA